MVPYNTMIWCELNMLYFYVDNVYRKICYQKFGEDMDGIFCIW